MRISSLQQFNLGLYGMLDNQTSLQHTYQQITTGRKIVTPADDPVAATKILQLEQEMGLGELFDKNADAALNRLGLEHDTLKSLIDNQIARARELTVQAGNGSYPEGGRQAIATEVRQILEAVVDIMNTRDASNEYIFSGDKGTTLPFVRQPNGDYRYEGDEGQRHLFIGKSTSVATHDNGKRIFMDVKSAENSFYTDNNVTNAGTGNISTGLVIDQEKYDEFYPDDLIVTFNPEAAIDPPGPNYTVRRKSDDRVVEGIAFRGFSPGQRLEVKGLSFQISGAPEPGDQFFVESSDKQGLTTTLKRFVDGFSTFTDNDGEQIEALVHDTLLNLDAARDSISEVVSEIGARMNTLESTKRLIQDVSIVNQETLSKVRDVDFTEAISRLQMESFLLDAAQQSYARISNLSLFNRL